METPDLLVALTVTLIAAAIGGAIAVRLGQSAVVGYIVAGLAIGPRTPGFVADAQVVRDLAELGVIFLMFSIGAQVSLVEIRRVGRLVAVGGTVQIAATIGLGWLVGLALGWSSFEAVFLGAFASISSTAIAARILGERGETETDHGLISIGWLAVQDLWTIVLIVLLTSVGGAAGAEDVAIAVGKAVLFLALALGIGGWVIPRVFEFIASFRRRELFTLGVVALTLGVAAAGSAFGISLALGAFVAGVLVSESDLSHQVLGEAVPFRDVFAGLFFVSIGMLVDPGLIVGSLPIVLVLLALIGPAKGLIVAAVSLLARQRFGTSALVGILLAQSAEFSFVLATIGTEVGAVTDEHFGLLLTSAALTIILAPGAYNWGRPLVDRLDARLIRHGSEPATALEPADHEGRRIAVILGYGRVGRLVATALERRGFGFFVIDDSPRTVHDARDAGVAAIHGNVENRVVLERAPLDRAAVLVVAVPDPVAVRFVVDSVRRAHPRLPIVARTHSQAERATLRGLGATTVVVGEVELALEMTRFALRQFGVSGPEVQSVITGLRER
ncbi:MAG TPA: cation:proton antiporter [Candidatus Deferrimicrobiaceae bacterium]|nr:cation:proton antiporter [Candidatus Deferrimicrobiaceae bacterium]